MWWTTWTWRGAKCPGTRGKFLGQTSAFYHRFNNSTAKGFATERALELMFCSFSAFFLPCLPRNKNSLRWSHPEPNKFAAKQPFELLVCKAAGQGGGAWEGTWASRTQKHREAGYRRPVDRGAWTAKTVKRPRQQPAHPQYANYWALLTRKRHIPPHPAQLRHTNYWALRTRKRHQQEPRPQRPTERSDPTQHAKGRTGDCPGPRSETATRRNFTRGVQPVSLAPRR